MWPWSSRMRVDPVLCEIVHVALLCEAVGRQATVVDVGERLRLIGHGLEHGVAARFVRLDAAGRLAQLRGC